MIPHAQTSTAGLFTLFFPDKIYGAIYLNVPQSASGLKRSATPLIPKSATFKSF